MIISLSNVIKQYVEENSQISKIENRTGEYIPIDKDISGSLIFKNNNKIMSINIKTFENIKYHTCDFTSSCELKMVK